MNERWAGHNETKFQLFLDGKIRSDGWVSPWRREQERRRNEEAMRPRIITAPQIKARQERKPKVVKERKPIAPPTPPRFCGFGDCQTRIRRANKTGRCIHHKLKAEPKAVTVCPYTGCKNKLRVSNKHGICCVHYRMFRRLIHQPPLAMCKQCGKRVRRKTMFGLCRAHARPMHSKLFNVRRRERRELRRAA
jgi:hypothetical protein